MPGVDAADEFETIERLFRPLAHPEWGRGLIDDVAALPSRPGYDLILTKDAMVEGVHFLPDDPLDTVARKLLRVNLSDLAAKGAEPFGYLLACFWPEASGWLEREAFAAGLAEDQVKFGVHLLGGDTVVTPGPASFSLTALGWVPHGRAVARAGAQPGDLIVVTGMIGDGILGLKAARGELGLEDERVAALTAHYRTPEPRVDFALAVREHAAAALDVSDGLIADMGHMASASGVGILIDLEKLPLSRAATAWFETRVDPVAALTELATGGDDYEIVMAVPPAAVEGLKRAADASHLRLTVLGAATQGEGVTVRHGGEVVPVKTTGWRHG
ncbi:thiamine-phosphate kinase [Brevundimonas sp. BAL450]|uniref:Thiamine-monophosphate kinase n=1 Tax=Brevundimonas abyssalis TAR-001 TaxID=1391729 RepID=A0A8E0KJD4_9CAUL|nr:MULTISPECIES: thiamine-phosphate kinase [Brevundimonas]MBG7613869.1 thiamine-phosphate kinase [Brevundimonas sp. BAL450]GAD59301.1 thiamine-monophosphate kinase [Brevundimonas abyssalis TAR-001]